MLAAVVNNPKFLYSSFTGLQNQDMMELLKQAGLRLKVSGAVMHILSRTSHLM